ncbi:SPOR domain-containing protein [Yeosuana sp. MJ-SS3]|uniref:SPOR domain-containing protein n=1 Tax=Gilvirhabdus luticola TaxID=3079858 RepID=A0ABU3U8C4_9FLAO|nr:SPOR domain-containing protein [Yeosuana sp. MJ-SS3]MDU8886660.1 SPOR domain-containing protein [Yeosuana sp. MJ-SS3]
MNFKPYTSAILLSYCFLALSNNIIAQEGTVTINQDKDIDLLLAIKKQMNGSEDTSDRYKIQVYSGNINDAQTARSKVKTTFVNWKTSLIFQTPNYKIWVGSFRTQLEADRALLKIKKEFPSAFILKPEK